MTSLREELERMKLSADSMGCDCYDTDDFCSLCEQKENYLKTLLDVCLELGEALDSDLLCVCKKIEGKVIAECFPHRALTSAAQKLKELK